MRFVSWAPDYSHQASWKVTLFRNLETLKWGEGRAQGESIKIVLWYSDLLYDVDTPIYKMRIYQDIEI